MMHILAFIFVFISSILLVYILLPLLLEAIKKFNRHRSQQISSKMDAMFVHSKEKRMMALNVLAPFLLGGAGLLFAPQQFRLVAGIGGFVVGFVVPNIYIRMLAGKRKKTFYNQLIDGLMMMNSSLKGGLSLLQAMEVVADEMPPPISQEFAILIGENKMGVSLETSFERLYSRMGTPALQQFISAVLLARETGGNLPVIFNRIIATIRENNKIQQNIETLTLQGKIQGFVMSGLPVVFAIFVYSSNPNYFDSMTSSDLGRTLLIVAGVLQFVGSILIIKISTIGDF